MIVSHRHRFIFFAVPRTGSHAARTALQPFLGPEDWQQEGLRTGVRSPLPAIARIRHGHVTLRQVQRHLPEALWRTYFKFTFVRNPYDRFVSACAMLNTRNTGYAGNETAVMKRMLTGLKGAVNAADFRKLMLVRPQAGLLVDEGGRIGMDFIGRYETLQDSFAEVCRRIGIPGQRLAIVNATVHRPWEDFYDDELCRLVTRFYRRDFEMLGYPPAVGPCGPANRSRAGPFPGVPTEPAANPMSATRPMPEAIADAGIRPRAPIGPSHRLPLRGSSTRR